MANSNSHNHRNCPLIVLGRGNGALEGGLHVKAANDTPMANVMLSLMHRLGMDDVKTFGDSTGEFSFDDAGHLVASHSRGEINMMRSRLQLTRSVVRPAADDGSSCARSATSPMADAAERGDAAAVRRPHRAGRRRQRAAGRRHDRAALGGA